MTSKKHVDYNDFNSEKVESLLKSTNVNDKIGALLYTVLGKSDYDKSDKLIFECCQSNEPTLEINAILCIGHLVRIHEHIDLDKYLPILESILSNQNKMLLDYAEDALQDIWIFYAKDKIKEIKQHTCVSRFFHVLQIALDAEKDEKYEEGIKRIIELRKTESNPSIIRVQHARIKYLSHFV